MKITLYKRLLSFLHPLCIERKSSNHHPLLELSLHRNQWQLSTEDAYYSDGKRYRPLRSAFRKIRKELSGAHRVLVLGTGIASGVQILEDMGFHPDYTLVDIDGTVLDMAIKLMPEQNLARIDPVCMDAEVFMQKNSQQYQLIVCDLFLGRNVPGFVSSNTFLEQCKTSLQPGGRFILNYLEKSKPLYTEICHLMQQVFPHYTMIEFGINKIFLATV